MKIKVAKDLIYRDIIIHAHYKWRVYKPFDYSFQKEIIFDEPKSFTTWGYHGIMEVNKVVSNLDVISESEIDEYMENELIEITEIDGCNLCPPQAVETWDNYPFVVLEKNEYKY